MLRLPEAKGIHAEIREQQHPRTECQSLRKRGHPNRSGNGNDMAYSVRGCRVRRDLCHEAAVGVWCGGWSIRRRRVPMQEAEAGIAQCETSDSGQAEKDIAWGCFNTAMMHECQRTSVWAWPWPMAGSTQITEGIHWNRQQH
jgi:hypothetical protein